MAMSTGKVVALIQAMGGGANPAVIEAKVEEWLDAHPEATTTVTDGSITEQKLATSIAQKLGLISSLSDEIDGIGSDVTDLKSALNENLISPKFVVNEYITNTGEFATSGNWSRTDYIKIDNLPRLCIESTKKSNYNYFYDINKSPLSKLIVLTGKNYYIIPDNAVYVALSNETAPMLSTKIWSANIAFDEQLVFELSQIKEQAYPFGIEWGKIVSTGGVIANDNVYATTGYVRITDGITSLFIRTAAATTYNAFYDANKVFIRSFRLTSGDNIVEVPVGAKYMVISCTTDTIKNLSITNIQASGDDNYIVRKEASQNLFNPATVTADKSLNGQGAEYVRAGSFVSDYIPVLPLSPYCQFTVGETNQQVRARGYVAFYDESRSLIGVNTSPYYEFVTPENCVYMRISNDVVGSIDTLSVMPGLFSQSIGWVKDSYEPSELGPWVDASKIQSIGGIDYTLVEEMCSKIRSINRLGYDCDNPTTPPQQTIESYALAIKYGFDTLLADLAWTADNVPVCFHDRTVNHYYKIVYNSDGTLFTVSPEIPISDKTYAEWEQYDFGLSKGEQYRGYKLPKIEDFLRFCKLTGRDAYLEIKQTMTDAQVDILIAMIKKIGVEDIVTFAGADTDIQSMIRIRDNSKCKRFARMAEDLSASSLNKFNLLKKDGVEVFWFGWGGYNITDADLQTMIENDIPFEMGTWDSEQAIIDFYTIKNNQYCTGMESNRLAPAKVICRNAVKILSV